MVKIELEGVTLDFPIFDAKASSIRNAVANIATGGVLGKSSSGIVTVRALDDISLYARQGDKIGLIGHNGSGKSTLIRLLAGIYSAQRGKMVVSGTRASIIELGAGLDKELSGLENIFRMALLNGMSRKEIDHEMDEIISFSGLSEFIKMPVRTYSSGMVVRLMFSVVTSQAKDILLIDEIFGAGDQEFQLKARARMLDRIGESGITIFSSHSMDLMRQFTNRFIRLAHGKLEEVSF